MATSIKKNAKNTIKKNTSKKAAPVKKAIASKKVIPSKKAIPIKKGLLNKLIAPLKPKTRVLYIDASFFFPPNNGTYTDNFQNGRISNNGTLMAPILLRVGSVMKTVTIYYKNNSSEELTVWILKHHIDHHAYSGEVEVSYEACPPGTSAPDNFLQKVIDHFDAGGKILDKYMYHIEIGPTIKTASEERLLRGIRIAYTEPA